MANYPFSILHYPIRPSLVVTAITEDKAWIEQLLESPHIDRLNVGATPTNRVQWDQPPEGNLFEFLYKRPSIGLTEQPKAA